MPPLRYFGSEYAVDGASSALCPVYSDKIGWQARPEAGGYSGLTRVRGLDYHCSGEALPESVNHRAEIGQADQLFSG
jgi:hypothetical protein